jgi:hypothetical protein
MKQSARLVAVLALASAGLSGCGQHLAKLGVCSSGPYRYANPKGVSLPSLSVPTPEDLNSPPSAPADAGPNAPSLSPSQPPAAPATAPDGTQLTTPPADNKAPIATPPKRGAMVLPRGATVFGSC